MTFNFAAPQERQPAPAGTVPRYHPDDIRSVMAANSPKLHGIALAVQRAIQHQQDRRTK